MDANMRSKGIVCVTGASGFLASWLVKRLLQSGYSVKGTVRDPENHNNVAHLWKLDGAKERLQLVKAELMEDGSFDDVIMGCEGVFHIASPVIAVKEDPKAEILDPAVKGTLNVLNSCKKNPCMKRVVLTSSSSTIRIREDMDPKIPLDETSWSSEELCVELKFWYAQSKILAEKTAWKFARENKIDLVTVAPSFIIGPSLPRKLGHTALEVLHFLQGYSHKFSWLGRMGYVHLDDVARCHILVFENAKAEGRYICSSSVLEKHELASMLAERYPRLPIPRSFESYSQRTPYEFNTSKLENMGFKFRSVEEMFDDCIQSLREQGHIAL